MAIVERQGYGRFEWVYRTFEGEDIWVDVSLTLIPARGALATYAVWRDVTHRKEAEKCLKLAEARYRDTFENAVSGIFQTTRRPLHKR